MTAKEFCNRVLPMKDKLFRLSRRILNNAEDAEDAVQEVFYKLWMKNEELDSFKSLEAFALVVTKNFCLDRVKSKSYQNSELTVVNEPVEHLSPGQMAEQKNEVEEVHRIVGRLPEQQRLILHLRDIEGLEYDEIEQIMEMNATAVRVNLSRARKAIREQLTATHNYEYQGD
jgi:RNA polymerase sigma-70 factor (ECF subfamily)